MSKKERRNVVRSAGEGSETILPGSANEGEIRGHGKCFFFFFFLDSIFVHLRVQNPM